ncbi:cell division control protein 6 homolog isoform X2 [Scyliorhinus canicula]|uniref:cell division control protein 6 homolog isoform X2 n=1 Tax=Scyliorhinus canicula TaxID=7830 RepID=UPI0018F5FF3E|nr:cell division control protein 6 homolog isoform X2 [Scyliorhinus canicula]
MPSMWKSRSQTTIDFPKKKFQRSCPASKGTRQESLPLSPRKRLDTENLCNVPKPLQCSPTKRKKENQPFAPLTPRGRKLEFDESLVKQAACSPEKHEPLADPFVTSKSPGRTANPLSKGCETPCSKNSFQGRKSLARNATQQGTLYQQTKQVLNTAIPERLLAREDETEAISRFIVGHVCDQKPGSLYISGAPGTGKTACVERIIEDGKGTLGDTIVISINCMSLRSSQTIFRSIVDKLYGKSKLRCAGKDFPRKLENKLTSPGPMVLLILDEMDQLDSKAQDILYRLFEWPWLTNSRLVLIGIANALDLTDRILPRLQARPKCKPELLNFAPYSREQIVAIVQDRLNQVSGENVFDSVAVQFCARKVSSVSGDARKALDMCRRAVEIVESNVRNQTTAEPVLEFSPAKPAPSPRLKKVGLLQVSQVVSEVDGDRMKSSSGSDECFPLQQKLLVCSLLLLTRQSKMKEFTLGKLHDTYSKVCRQHQMSGVDQSECLSLCSLLESRGIVSLKRAKEARLTKVALKIEEKDVEYALHDKVLMGNILQRGLP